MAMATETRAALARESLRVAERYAVEVIEAFGLCPWAENVRNEGRLKRTVLFTSSLNDEAVVEAAAAAASLAKSKDADVTLLLYPCLDVDRASFRAFVSQVESAHALAAPMTIAMAAFHPDAEADLESPARLIPFLRRSPDPTIQLVPLQILAEARRTRDEGSEFASGLSALHAMAGAKKKRLGVSESIARANLATAKKLGVKAIEAVLADIQRDRDESYAAVRRQAKR